MLKWLCRWFGIHSRTPVGATVIENRVCPVLVCVFCDKYVVDVRGYGDLKPKYKDWKPK